MPRNCMPPAADLSGVFAGRRRWSAVLLTAVLIAASNTLDAATQRRVSPFWTSIEDCLTTVHLRNNLIDEELVVQPVFHLEDGTAVPVDPVTLTPRGNASIQVNQLMTALGYGDARFGGAEFLYEKEFFTRRNTAAPSTWKPRC